MNHTLRNLLYHSDTHVMKPQAKRRLTVPDTVQSTVKQHQSKTANIKQISVITFHLFTTDRSIFKQAVYTECKMVEQTPGICLFYR